MNFRKSKFIEFLHTHSYHCALSLCLFYQFLITLIICLDQNHLMLANLMLGDNKQICRFLFYMKGSVTETPDYFKKKAFFGHLTLKHNFKLKVHEVNFFHNDYLTR